MRMAQFLTKSLKNPRTLLYASRGPKTTKRILFYHLPKVCIQQRNNKGTIPREGNKTGCTVSPVALFKMGINLLIKSADRETRRPFTKSEVRLLPNRGFIDDWTITTQTYVQTRWILKNLDDTTTWARIKN